MNANPLLRRQLKRHLGLTAAPEPADLARLLGEAMHSPDAAKRLAESLTALIGAVADAYEQYERDIHLRGRSLSLDLSSAELQGSNERLRAEIRSRKAALEALVAAANRLRAEAGLPDLDPDEPHDVSAIGEMMAALLQARREAETNLRLAARVIESTNEGITVTDAHGTIVSVNPAFTQVTGYAAEEVIGRNPRLLQSGRQDEAFYRRMWQTIHATGRWRGEIWNRKKSGEIYPEWLSVNAVLDTAGNVTHYVGVFADITLLKESQERLNFLAHHDPLTGLPNRMLFNSRLGHSIQRARREQRELAVLFIDLDHFKDVNDTLGHPAGDTLLCDVATRLSAALRANDTLARMGGDEFILLLEDANNLHVVRQVAEKLHAALLRPFPMLEHELFVGASIGISLFPADGDTVESRIKNADAAMYQAKAHGRNTFHFYTASMTEQAMERLRLEGQLRGALERDELVLHFQPQFDMSDGRLIGAEALIRWHHPVLGIVSPVRFIPLAEETGFIVAIGEWVLRQACRQLAAWDAAGLNVPYVAVNLSAKQFRNSDLLATVQAALAESGIAPQRLELEITESLIMECNDVMPIMDHLRELGVSISIDDFGTGYSSLSYLKHLPNDRLKIDRSFVIDVGRDKNDETIIRAIINLGRNLGLNVLAEGVETTDQAEFLAREGCTDVQGFLFAKPQTADDFSAYWLARGVSGHPG